MNIFKMVYKSLPNSISSPIRYIIELCLWKAGIHKNPGHSIKQRLIRDLQKRYNINTFIETGTYEGDMIMAQESNFKNIYSLELSEYYFNQAKLKFAGKNNIHLILGDSSIELGKLLKTINERAIIFLDGHFSGGNTAKGSSECPLAIELEALAGAEIKNHILMIDDIRLCGKNKDYPTIEELKKYVKNINGSYEISILNDQLIAII